MNHKRLISSILAASLLAFPLFLSATPVSLDGAWKLDYWEQGRKPAMSPEEMAGVQYETVDATVPGNVELDLLAAGLVEDPELGSNVYLLRPWEGYQWRYSRTFATPEHDADDDIVLTFEGIDCFAEVYVNGKHVGSADNMLISYTYDVTDVVNPSGAENTVEVYIRSAVIEGRSHLIAPISLNFAQPESVYCRRAPHTFGWDIMPRLVSAGLWKSVEVEVRKPVRIVDMNWLTLSVDPANRQARMRLDFNITLPVKYHGKLISDFRITRNGKEYLHVAPKIAAHAGAYVVNVEDVDYWWPRGYGEPALYDAEFSILDLDGNVIDRNVQKIGIRTIRLDYSEVNTKEKPGRFCFIVNGERVYARGSNWTPMDAFHSRDPQWLQRTFDLVTDLNCNMIRCWGGNVYESDEFYDLCDANGVMVWQDFTMGCTFYSQLSDFQKKIEEEIYNVVLRLRRHPSIALWAGNNEDDQTLTIGTLAPYRPDPNKDVVSRQTIPHVLFELDPSRTYLPSSPYWSEELVKTSYSTADLPEDHIWGPRGYYKEPYYTQMSCLFVSEIGYHGMPNRESLEKMFPAESVYPWTDRKNFHWNEDWLTKAVRVYEEQGYTPDRNNLMINQVKCLFGEVPSDLDDFIFASQSVQAEAMKYFVEKFRGHKFEPCTGMLWWNIRDGWPLISDAVTDFYFSPKMAYYFLRNVQRDVCVVMCDAESGRYPLVAVNDTREPVEGKVEVKDIASGKKVYSGKYNVPANSRQVIAGLPEQDGQGMYLITYTSPDGEHTNHYLYGTAPYDMKEYRGWLKKTKTYNIK